VVSYNKLMWADNSSSSGLISAWAASQLGGSNDGASGFKLRGAVPTGREDVSSVTREVGARALPHPLSVTAGRVYKGIPKVVSVVTLEAGAGWGVERDIVPLGRN